MFQDTEEGAIGSATLGTVLHVCKAWYLLGSLDGSIC